MIVFNKDITEKSLDKTALDDQWRPTGLDNIDFESEETSDVSSGLDFESDKFIDPSLFLPVKPPPGIYMPKEQSTWEKFRSLIVDPGMDKDKAANIVSLADEYGLSPTQAEKYYDELGSLTFAGTYPTSRDVASGLMGAAVTTGIIFNPVATAIGVGTFMGLDELENYIVSRIKEDPYHFQEGKGLSDLLDAHGLSEDAIDLLDFTWKIPVAGKVAKFGRGSFGAITSRIKDSTNKVNFVNKVVEDVKTEKITPDEAALKNAEEFGLNKDQLIEAQRNKEAEIKPEVGEIERPLEVTRPTDAIPTYTFTSQRGNFYEKIGEKWYDRKGKEVTHKYAIKAAEKGKAKFGEDEVVAEEKVVSEIEEKFKKRIEEVSEEEIGKYYAEKEVVEVKPKIEPVEVKPETKVEPKVPEFPESKIKLEELKEPITEVKLPELKDEKSPFFQDIKTTEVYRKLYEERAKSVTTDPELLTQKLINDVNRWHKGEDIPIDKVCNMLNELSSRADELRMDFLTGQDHAAWKATVSEATQWARNLDRLKIKPTVEPTKFYSGIPIFELFKKPLKPTPKPPEPFPSVKSKAKELVLERRARLNLANYETNKFINSVEQKLDFTQREAMPFVIEGTNVPKELGRPDLQRVISKNKDLLNSVAKEVKQHFNEGWQKIKTHIPDLSVKQIEDYVTHLWEVPKHKRAEAVSWFQTQNRLLERRFIDTYKDGIERGFKPKVLDISEIIRIHDTVSNRAIENTKYIKSLLKLKDQGAYLIQRTGTAPLEWVEVDYPALTRRIPLPKKAAGKKDEFVKELKVRVHPDLVRPLKAIFEQRFDHPVISAYEAINGILKKSMLSISLFHPGALGETGIALMGLAKTAKIMFNPVKIYRALAKGEYDIFRKEPIARDSIESGVQYGATADIPVGRIQGYLDSLARSTENTVMLNRITKLMSGGNRIWDKALWNYLHDTLKLYGYETLVSKLDPNMGPKATKMTKREIAQLINDTFGGQNWDTLMITPKEVQMLTWSLLSADWTFSTTRQALSPTGIGKVYKETADVRKKMGRSFWLRAGLYFGLGINTLNALFREQDMKENPQYYRDKEYTSLDKTMFGNTLGKKTKLFVGRYKDGSERYLKWGKQFSDFYELVASPIKKIGGKAAPVPQIISETFTGHTLSGFKNDDVYGKKGFEKTLGIFKTIAKAPIPITLKRLMHENIEFKPTDVFMPSSKGMSRYRALEYFKTAIVNQDDDLLREVYENCLRNNLPPYTLFNGALSWTENEIMADISKTVVDIKDAEIKLSAANSAYEKRKYGIILKRLQKEKADKKTGLNTIKSAINKAKVYSDLRNNRFPNRRR